MAACRDGGTPTSSGTRGKAQKQSVLHRRCRGRRSAIRLRQRRDSVPPTARALRRRARAFGLRRRRLARRLLCPGWPVRAGVSDRVAFHRLRRSIISQSRRRPFRRCNRLPPASVASPAVTAMASRSATSTVTVTPTCSSRAGGRMPSTATRGMERSRTSPSSGASAADGIGPRRRRWPTSTATATLTSTSATTPRGISTILGSVATLPTAPTSTATLLIPRLCPITYFAMTRAVSLM